MCLLYDPSIHPSIYLWATINSAWVYFYPDSHKTPQCVTYGGNFVCVDHVACLLLICLGGSRRCVLKVEKRLAVSFAIYSDDHGLLMIVITLIAKEEEAEDLFCK